MASDARVLVCGDRNWWDTELLEETLDDIHAEFGIALIIEGEARGADSMGREWARSRAVPFEAYSADWSRYGRAAGPIRNQQMLDIGRPTLGVAFHDNLTESKGTADMVRKLEAAGVPVRRISHGQQEAT